MYTGKTKLLREKGNNSIHLALNFHGLCIKACDKRVYDIKKIEIGTTDEVTCKECIKLLKKADQNGKAVI